MSKAYNTVKVDSEKFHAVLKKRGLTCTDIAKAMGHAAKYISNKVYKQPGMMLPGDVKFIEAVYNIKPDEYAWVEPVVEAAQPASVPEKKATVISPVRITNPVQLSVDEEKTYQLIYKAVYDAMKMALAE